MKDRFLANENFPREIVGWLRDQGSDVLHAADSLQGESDSIVLNSARSDDRVLLTFDADFGEHVFHQREAPAPGIVLLRVPQNSPSLVLPFLRQFFAMEVSLRGHFTVASPGHIRQTSLPS